MGQAQPPSDVRSEILRVATRRFARQGFSGTSLQQIVDEVGIRKPSLLHYFPSKDLLLEGVLDNLFEHWTDTLPSLLKAVTKGRDRFEAITQELLDFFQRDPDRARLVVREMMDRPEQIQARLNKTLIPWVTLIADYIRKSQEADQLRKDVDPESYILHIVTLAISGIAAMPVVVDALPHDRETAAEMHMRELKRIARTGLFET